MGAADQKPRNALPGGGRAKPLWPWLVAAAIVFMGLVALGTWQVQRMAWKHELIARVDARIHATAVPAPDSAQWPGVGRASHEYLRVTVKGRFLHEQEALVQATTALGAGFWVLTPLQVDDGTVVWINRGFVTPTARNPANRGKVSPEGEVSVTGLLRISEPGGAFLRNNDPAANRWHSRDLDALSTSRGLPQEIVAPYFIDEESGPGGKSAEPGQFKDGPWPVAGLTVVRFSDSHLVYALTWYGLALGLLAAMAFVWLSRNRARAG